MLKHVGGKRQSGFAIDVNWTGFDQVRPRSVDFAAKSPKPLPPGTMLSKTRYAFGGFAPSVTMRASSFAKFFPAVTFERLQLSPPSWETATSIGECGPPPLICAQVT